MSGRKKLKAPGLKAISSTGRIINSSHTFNAVGNVLHCVVCHQRSPWQAILRRQWLSTPCVPDDKFTDALVCGRVRPTPVPKHVKVHVGRTELHATHELEVYQGMYFCKVCGYVASVKPQRLAAPCTRSSAEALKRVHALKRGKLPSGVHAWPNQKASRELALVSLED